MQLNAAPGRSEPCPGARMSYPEKLRDVGTRTTQPQWVTENQGKKEHSCFCLGPGLSLLTTVTEFDSARALHPILRPLPHRPFQHFWGWQFLEGRMHKCITLKCINLKRVNTTRGENCECVLLSVTGIYEWFLILFSD